MIKLLILSIYYIKLLEEVCRYIYIRYTVNGNLPGE